MRAANALAFAGSSDGLVQAQPPPTPRSLMRKVKPKRALLTQENMGIGNVVQPIVVFSCLCERNSCANILNACAMQFRLPQKSIPYTL